MKKLLAEKKAPILKRWFNLIAETYPAEVSSFLGEKDRFTNPVGFTISQEIDALYEQLLQDTVNSEQVSASLDNIIKIRALQDFSPHQAIAFVFLLKKAIRDEMGGEMERKQLLGEWLNLESGIDKLASLAFDIYMECREKIYQLRVDEVKAERERAFRLLDLMGGLNRKDEEVT